MNRRESMARTSEVGAEAAAESDIGPDGATPVLTPPRARRGTRALMYATDLASIAGAAVLASRAADAESWPTAGLFIAVTLAWMIWHGLYRSRLITRISDELRRLTQAVLLAFASIAGLSFLFDLEPQRSALIIAAASSWLLLAATRSIWRFYFDRLRGSGALVRPTVLVGVNPEADILADMLADDPSLGYSVCDRIDPSKEPRPERLTTAVLASVRRHGASSVLVSGSGVELAALNRLCRDLLSVGIHVELSVSLIDIMHRRLTVRPLGRFPVAYLEPVPRSGWRPVAKRCFDLFGAGLGLMLLSPMLVLIAVAVRVTSEGPIIFRQERIGQHGVAFNMFKFRTMVSDAEERLSEVQLELHGRDPLFKLADDPRVTRVGRLLRRTSLDEFPQLVNVIRGEMSLVGPRPALQREMNDWSAELYARLRVRPGITGLWQVSGRSDAGFTEYTRLDLFYVDNWSLATDVAILARTAAAVVRRNGAY